jgi:hypothetical protein
MVGVGVPGESTAGTEVKVRGPGCRLWSPASQNAELGTRVEDVRPWRAFNLVPPAPRPADNGLDAWALVLGNGYEGYVAKNEASPYRGGARRS